MKFEDLEDGMLVRDTDDGMIMQYNYRTKRDVFVANGLEWGVCQFDISHFEKVEDKNVIRKSTMDDLDAIQEIYAYAREQMRINNNPNQWGTNRPLTESIVADIKNGNSYAIMKEDKLVGVFSFIIGEDPTYINIEDGQWLNQEPYGTIHKIAAGAEGKNIFRSCYSFCKKFVPNIRIDTHKDNRIMQKILEQYEFTKCGIIYVDDGTPRIAYQKVMQPQRKEK